MWGLLFCFCLIQIDLADDGHAEGCASFHFLEVLFMHSTYGHGIATEVEDKLAVAVDADNVALISFEWSCEHAQLDMIFGKLLEGIAQKCDILWMCFHHIHEWLHDGVAYGGRTACAAVVDKMILREICLEKRLDVSHRTLQKHKATDSGREFFLQPALLFLILITITVCLMNEIGLLAVFGIICLEPFKQRASCHVLQKEVAP